MKNKAISTFLKTLQVRNLIMAAVIGTIVSPQFVRSETESGKVRAKQKAGAVLRDPFWPVGYEPETVYRSEESDTPVRRKATPGGIDWEEAMKQVRINGVSSRAEEYIAVINNEVKSVGEQVSIEYAGVKYTWKVESITPPGSVKLRRHVAE